MTFSECVMECFSNRELVTEFNRLHGYSLGVDSLSAIEKAVDQATGHKPSLVDTDDALEFIEFVRDVIWDRLPQGN